MNNKKKSKAFYFDNLVNKQLDKFLEPASLISELFLAKLRENKIHLDAQEVASLQKAIEHLIKSSLFSFNLDDKHLVSSGLSEQELTEIIESFITGLSEQITNTVERLSNSLKTILSEVCEKLAQDQFSSLKKNCADTLELIQSDIKKFELRLRGYWGRSLDWLEVLIGISIESGELIYQTHALSELEKSPSEISDRNQILFALHARACQIAGEILALLKTGFADGAHGRWRSLHEVCVVGIYISQSSEETAKRYYHHRAIEDLRHMESELDRFPYLQHDKNAMKYYKSLKNTTEKLINQFGIGFETDYGWAAESLGKRKPTFRDLEAAAEIDSLRVKYKKASLNVHGSAKGTFERLGVPKSAGLGVLAGRSDHGLEHAGQLTAMSLGYFTIYLLSIEPTVDMIVRANLVSEIWPEVSDSFLTTATKLKRNISKKEDSKIVRRFERKR